MSTTTTTIAYPRRSGLLLTRLRDYAELTKPKIVIMLLATVAAVAFQATPDPLVVLHAVVGIGLVAASSSVTSW